MSVTAATQPITVVASTGTSNVSAVVSGGVGPQGPQGIPGDALSAASDVVLSGLADGDVLRYSANKWRNHPEQLLIDGGNYLFLLAFFFS